MIQKINTWLASPKRKYKEGLQIFNAMASDVQMKNFKFFFEKDADKVTDQFDIKFTTLVNQIVFIQAKIKSNPQAYTQAVSSVVKDSDENTDPVADENKKKVVVGADDTLPKELEPVMLRIKEIVPLMAKLHADMSSEPADDKRIPIMNELIALDDERRKAWAQIDNYEPSEEEKEIEVKTMAMGADIHKRILQVKENIARNKDKIKIHTANKKMTYAAKAKENVEKYTDELAQLEMLVR